ncbi:MAG: Dps family protein [Thermoplasmatota archaeon]
MNLPDVIHKTHAQQLNLQLAHWNITGPNFIALHELLAEQYEELGDGIDALAERHRHLQNLVPATALAGAPDVDGNWETMLRTLVQGHEALLDALHALEETAAAAGDPGTADLATERIRAHHEHAWKLRAHLQ